MDKYQQAFGVARAIYKAPYTTVDQRDALAGVFPELREIGIREWLLGECQKMVNYCKHDLSISKNDHETEEELARYETAVEWLKKQNESKCESCPNRGNTHSYIHGYEDGMRGAMQKSEEDVKRIDAICNLLENTIAIHPNYHTDDLISWLKSLKNKMI